MKLTTKQIAMLSNLQPINGEVDLSKVNKTGGSLGLRLHYTNQRGIQVRRLLMPDGTLEDYR